MHGLTVGDNHNETITFLGGKEYSIDLYSIYGFTDWSTKKLITMATCKSGGDDTPSKNSIAYKISSLGAQMVIGWYTDFSSISGPSWLNNYHEQIGAGENIQTAMEYANDKIYLYNNVKNVHLCYNSITPLALDAGISINSLVNKEKQNNIMTSMDLSIDSKDNAESIIKKYDLNFDESQYEKIISDGIYLTNVKTGETKKEKSYIDYVLKIGDYITNSGYTVVIDKDDKIEAIYDNTIESATQKMNNISNSIYSVSNADREYYLNKARTSIEDPSKILDEEISFYYDIKNDKKGAYVLVYLDEGESGNTVEFNYEINN